jgi:glutamate/tyrosine decarboxylase-like PLP-dependent enzyme
MAGGNLWIAHRNRGGFVTGATMANFSVWRGAACPLEKQGWDVEAQGLFEAPPIQVVVSDEVHVSVLKALGMLGMGRERLIRVPTDERGRMRADALRCWITQRLFVCKPET